MGVDEEGVWFGGWVGVCELMCEHLGETVGWVRRLVRAAWRSL